MSTTLINLRKIKLNQKPHETFLFKLVEMQECSLNPVVYNVIKKGILIQ
jgi:hypothetical protein